MSLKSLLPFAQKRGDLTLDPFFSLHRDINRAFDDVFKQFGGVNWSDNSPRIDVKESAAGVEISAELPGVDEKDIDVELVDDVLTIKGEKKVEKEEKDEKTGYYLSERSYGTFARSIRLPYSVDPGKVKADFDKGVLKIICPRPAEVEAKAKRIAIQTH